MPSSASHDREDTTPNVVEHVSLEHTVSTRVASGRCHVSYSRIVSRAMVETDPLLLEADALGFRPRATGTYCAKREGESGGWRIPERGASENASSIPAGPGNWRVALLIWMMRNISTHAILEYKFNI
ncbi:hypothetical protein MUK42_20546 [Musa troglodytarum]|uniref:Uncharacterized protein n=1 Tax=Musa troglodytarum TaxID=320322 RepID=A0A9E7FB31_9LILI|nr:hypothetical protein MUK42_20546 [Musa troglodytarum]